MFRREIYQNQIDAGFKYNPIVVLLGARQVGKTTIMEMYGANKETFWLNGEDPEVMEIFTSFSNLERFLKVNINTELKGLLIIDEFQYINGIAVMLKLLVDKNKTLKILCSGSSGLDIIQKVEESLAGRIRTIPVYSLSLQEYIRFYDEQLEQKFIAFSISDNIELFLPQLPPLFKEYLLYGGMPKAALAIDTDEKEALLDDIYQTYLLRDVRQYVRNQDAVGFNKLLKVLSSQIGNLININELSNTVQLSYRMCEEYIFLLEQMFIIYLVSPFTTNKRHEITKMKKVYFCDLGLRNTIYNSFNDIDIRVDNGQLFENYVFLELLKSRKKSQIFYYRTKDATEIDFIIVDNKQKVVPIEVKYKRIDKIRKIRAITEFAKSREFDKSYFVNLSQIASIDNLSIVQPYFINQIY